MATTFDNNDPAAIEDEIRKTQDNMSSTIDKIAEQLTPKKLFNALLDKADQNNVDARMVFDTARRNPIALGLISIGAIWLISEKDSKIPSFGSKSSTGTSSGSQGRSYDDYTKYMSSVQRGDDEGDEDYLGRHDEARSQFFGTERSESEDAKGFRARLDAMTNSLKDTGRRWSTNTGKLGTATKDRAFAAKDKASEYYDANPLIGGLIAAAGGAALAAALPVTRTEREKLAPLGDKARSMVGEQTGKLSEQVREKKDQLVGSAHEALKGDESSSDGNNADAQGDKPFMAG